MRCRKHHVENLELINAIHSENRRRGWNLADLASHMGISHIYMASLSNGARPISALGLDKKRLLADYLGISLVELLLECGVLMDEDFPRDLVITRMANRYPFSSRVSA